MNRRNFFIYKLQRYTEHLYISQFITLSTKIFLSKTHRYHNCTDHNSIVSHDLDKSFASLWILAQEVDKAFLGQPNIWGRDHHLVGVVTPSSSSCSRPPHRVPGYKNDNTYKIIGLYSYLILIDLIKLCLREMTKRTLNLWLIDSTQRLWTFHLWWWSSKISTLVL